MLPCLRRAAVALRDVAQAPVDLHGRIVTPVCAECRHFAARKRLRDAVGSGRCVFRIPQPARFTRPQFHQIGPVLPGPAILRRGSGRVGLCLRGGGVIEAVSGWASDPAWGSGQELAWGSGQELASDPGPFSIRNRPSCCRLNYPYCRNYCSNRLSCRNYRNCCSCSNCRSFRNYRNCRYLRNCRIRHPIPNRRKMLPVLLR